jgi:nitroreductase
MPTNDTWRTFRAVLEQRRAIRDFDDAPIDEHRLRQVLEAALLAPSSSNLQLFRLHVVTSPDKRALLAAACMGQRAARGAPVLIAVAACPQEAAASLAEQAQALSEELTLTPSARQHALDHVKTMRAVVRWTSLTAFAPLVRFALWCARFARPVPELPAGERAFRQWAVRNSAFAAQTLMLAAEAHGYASCPMEGFDRFRVQRALGLQHEHVWLVIALGHRADNARVEPRWRRPFSTMIRLH